MPRPADRTSLLRSWRSAVLAPVGDGPQRRRRGSDGAGLAGAALTLACCLLIIRHDSQVDRAIAQSIHPPPGSVTWLVTTIYQAGSLGLTAALAALALIARSWVTGRDIALSAACAGAVSAIVIAVLGPSGGRPAGLAIGGYLLGFPVPRIALLMAVAAAALPYLARGVRRLTGVFVALTALASAVGGHGLPVNVVGSLAIGWAAAMAVRLVFGSPLGQPSSGDVRLLLQDLGIDVDEVRPGRPAEGVAKYQAAQAGRTGPGTCRLSIEVYGRDAADARLLTKAVRFLLYTGGGTTFTITRLQQVEHQAYLTLRAGQAGANVPELLEAGIAGPAKDALVVCRVPAGQALADTDAAGISDASLDDLYRQLLALREARIAHGAISGDTLLADAVSKTIVLAEFRHASSSAPPDRLDRDLAAAMAATALAVGIPRAAAAAARCLPREILRGALRHLHGPALDPVLRRQVKEHDIPLRELRGRAAQAASIEVPDLVEPRRVSWPTLVMITGTLIGGWALIGVLVNVAESFDTVIAAEWLWVIPALVLAQLTFVASAAQCIGGVTGPLPFARVLAVEVASAFSVLAGGRPAVFATRVRFFQQEGYDASAALSSGAIITGASWIAVLALLAISLPLTWGSIRLEALRESGDPKVAWLALAAVVAVALMAGLVLAVPRLRRLAVRKALPKARGIAGTFTTVASSPGKLLLLGGGAVARELLLAGTLFVSLRAFGDHLALPVLIVIIGLASMAGGASPSPGGIGVVEASLILGLTTAGAAEADATAAVFIQRLLTSYLPPVWGALTLIWLRKREYL